jgi:predicted dithiol-disulfide oxidoreductase (DUF899 family)
MQHPIVSREEWLTARLDLLKAEKALTRQSDALAQQRMAIPWVKLDQEYQFETDAGKAKLVDLFQGRSQLMVYHFMFGPDYNAGCPSCSAIADSFDGIRTHLANHDVMLWAVSRAPLPKLQEYKQRMGWKFPWASSNGSNFNGDFSVSFTEEEWHDGVKYNYRKSQANKDGPLVEHGEMARKNELLESIASSTGTNWATYSREAPGMSAFVLDNGSVYHTYSTYARGLDVLWNTYQWLDRAPKGRNETGYWWKRHDEYENNLVQLSIANSCCHAK